MSTTQEMTQDMPPVSPVVRALRPALSAILTLASLAWAADLYRRAGFMFLTENFLAFALGLALALVYLHFPFHRGTRRSHLPWYDGLAALAGLGAGLYVAVFYDRIVMQFFTMPIDGLIAAAIMIVLSVEGLRRSAGIALPIILGIFVVYAMVGHLVPGALQARPVQMQNLVLYLGIDASGVFGIVMLVAVTVVIPYVFFGQLLLNSGATHFFNDISLALMGRYRGGSAKISITASGMFGSISGVVVSNILATGVITIGLMKRAGFTPRQAAAIEATASTGGQMMPPIMGAVAFLMADLLQRPYQDIIVAAIIPSLLYFSALFIQADLEAARRGIDRVPEEEIPRTRDVMRSGWIYLLPFVLLVVGLFRWNWRPEYAAIYASLMVIALAMTIGYKGQRMTLRQVWQSITATGMAALEILMIAVAAGCIMGILQLTGLGFALTMVLVQLGAGNLIAILMIAAVMCIVLGMGMPTLGVYVLLAVLVAPSLIEVGIDPLAAHMFILYLGMMSMITPPIAVGAFFAATLAGSEPMRTGFTAMRFGWTAYIIPFLFVFSPGLLLQGGLDLDTVLTIISALAGVWFISAAFAGFGLGRL
ncbi:MAG: TRAP transporter fused permease subunit, partial [Rhodobacteraceae bacterium]|nr:TRAP transporter fused permease subunit [Paracoccaceae bacterium]